MVLTKKYISTFFFHDKLLGYNSQYMPLDYKFVALLTWPLREHVVIVMN